MPITARKASKKSASSPKKIGFRTVIEPPIGLDLLFPPSPTEEAHRAVSNLAIQGGASSFCTQNTAEGLLLRTNFHTKQDLRRFEKFMRVLKQEVPEQILNFLSADIFAAARHKANIVLKDTRYLVFPVPKAVA